MVGIEFIRYISDLNIVEYAGVEDFADKLSFLYSVLVLMLSTLIISTKQYFSSSIACYIPTVPSGSDFERYLENYCWVHGTIPILGSENIPQNKTSWATMDKNHRINYYQWVPFMLGLQTMLFYTPRLVWQLICHNRTGTDLESLIEVAVKADKKTGGARKDDVEHVATSLELMLYQHRELRSSKRAKYQMKAKSTVGFCIPSKRLGTWLICSYLFIKVLYFANAIGQVFLMQRFLGFDDSFASFGISVAQGISNGHDWKSSRIFPRVSYCFVENIRQLGASNQYVSQCVLPINMLNEKLYIFLWFWTTLVAIFTGISIPIWTYRISQMKSRMSFIKKFIWLKKNLRNEPEGVIEHFIDKFLRHDGVFLLRMISMNAGDVIASDIIYRLYEIHYEKYRDEDFGVCCFENPQKNVKLIHGQNQTILQRGGNAQKGSDC